MQKNDNWRDVMFSGGFFVFQGPMQLSDFAEVFSGKMVQLQKDPLN